MSQAVILHVEDDANDALFVAHAFQNGLPECVLRRVKDGREAIDYLDGTGEFATPGSHPKPDLVLLDLKLPDVDGFEVLEWMRSQAQFKSLKVIILSGSSVAKDKERSLRLGANAYFVKTPSYQDVIAYVARLLQTEKAALSPGNQDDVRQQPGTDSATDLQASA